MSTSTVLYIDYDPLLLEEIERDDNGKIKSAWVVNGAWKLEIRGNILYVEGDFYIRPFESSFEVAVPNSEYMNYGSIISEANKTVLEGILG
jgi:hypothetical protein